MSTQNLKNSADTGKKKNRQLQQQRPAVQVTSIIPEAFYGWPEVHQLTRLSREYWRQLRHAGKAPEPTYVANRALWRGADMLEWLRDPHEYQAPRFSPEQGA